MGHYKGILAQEGVKKWHILGTPYGPILQYGFFTRFCWCLSTKRVQITYAYISHFFDLLLKLRSHFFDQFLSIFDHFLVIFWSFFWSFWGDFLVFFRVFLLVFLVCF